VVVLIILSSSPARSTEVGEQLPDFSVQTFDGKHLSRTSFAGKPLLLVFWNTWCAECKRDLPKINRMAREFGPKGLAILAINTGLNDSESKARVFWKKYGITFPTGYDSSFEIRKDFQVLGVPTVFLVDTKGIVRYKSSAPPVDMGERFRTLSTE